MCSTVAQTCMPPYPWPTQFTNSYDCMVAGYTEALRKTEEIGEEEVNKNRIYIKFVCAAEPKEEIEKQETKLEV